MNIIYRHGLGGAIVYNLLPLLFQTDLHRTRLTHTDLKPENILFVDSDFDNYFDARMVGDVNSGYVDGG